MNIKNKPKINYVLYFYIINPTEFIYVLFYSLRFYNKFKQSSVL